MAKLLIADDHQQITEVLKEYAQKEGHQAVVAADGEAALELFETEKPDVVLLDVMMPRTDGFAVCRQIRQSSNVPVIMITARGEDFERIMGLDIGADDYIVKPFSPAEVMARVRALLRRLTPTEEDTAGQVYRYSNLTIDLDRFIVSIDDQKIPLTKKETELLWTLATGRNRVYSRDNLLNLLWGYDYFGDNRTVDSHIKRLRAKLDAVAHPDWEVKTIWGVGYQFAGNAHEA